MSEVLVKISKLAGLYLSALFLVYPHSVNAENYAGVIEDIEVFEQFVLVAKGTEHGQLILADMRERVLDIYSKERFIKLVVVLDLDGSAGDSPLNVSGYPVTNFLLAGHNCLRTFSVVEDYPFKSTRYDKYEWEGICGILSVFWSLEEWDILPLEEHSKKKRINKSTLADIIDASGKPPGQSGTSMEQQAQAHEAFSSSESKIECDIRKKIPNRPFFDGMWSGWRDIKDWVDDDKDCTLAIWADKVAHAMHIKDVEMMSGNVGVEITTTDTSRQGVNGELVEANPGTQVWSTFFESGSNGSNNVQIANTKGANKDWFNKLKFWEMEVWCCTKSAVVAQ